MTDLCVVLVVQAAVSVPWVLPRDPGLEPASPTAYLLTTLTVLPLLWRRRAPVRVLLAVVAAQGLYGLAVDGPGQTLPYTGLVALYSVAAHAPSPSRQLCGALTLAVVFPSVAFNTGEARELVFSLMVFTAAYGFGRFTDTRQAYTRAVEDRARQLEVTRRIEAEQAAARERARIAREMHDILSHAVSLMIVQAEAGPVAVRTAPERAEAAFDAISETGRDAMVQLRRMLGVLREEGQGPGAPRSPQPALDGLPALVERVRSSGLAVTHTVTGPERPLPRDTDSAVFRIVQEALTNTVKHAAATEAAVLLAYGESSLTVSVTDDGVGMGTDTHSGHGLIGIRERAAAHGGGARTGPGPDGRGFRVDVTLPLAPVTSSLEVGS
ncbi:sensor histidine kinase [Streptomyces drozdowiczii]|uniref:histidine kinase n=1 Tax=Streptomyces drozdowiczii TaxID=202862 RepID=A0ABY6Q398_9ACTN|nr:histidine kinase [Streptomyces drozdowiczii]MCX0246327.1 histidine kinase [Streptomyces drozdowiczii]UZK58429.1 histidine kinase [Streptomyces drozdowiczii]